MMAFTARWIVLASFAALALGAVACGDTAEPTDVGPVTLAEWLTDCVPGQTRCVDAQLATCPAAGGAAELVACPGTMACDIAAAGGAACTLEACANADAVCLDDATAGVCGAAGERRVHVACAPGERCEAGACVAQPLGCGAPGMVCDGDVRVECTVGGDTERVDCGAACTSEDGCTCADGACVERVCMPGAGRCVDGVPQRCGGAGLRWLEQPTCGAGERCDAGVCVIEDCDPGTGYRCLGDTVIWCEDGTPRVDDCAARGEQCRDLDGRARCLPQVCAPGTSVCRDGGRWTCAGDGSRYLPDPCLGFEQCMDGACTMLRVCSEGQDNLCAGQHIWTCEGSAWTPIEACDGDEACHNGVCAPLLCVPGTTRCADADTMVTCDDPFGTGPAERLQRCVAGCDAASGRCARPVCERPGATYCFDDELWACADDGTTYTRVDDCGGVGCLSGACGGTDVGEGEPCRVDENCAAGHCSNGVCTPAGFEYVPPGSYSIPLVRFYEGVFQSELGPVRITTSYGIQVAQLPVRQVEGPWPPGLDRNDPNGDGVSVRVDRAGFVLFDFGDTWAYANAMSVWHGLDECLGRYPFGRPVEGCVGAGIDDELSRSECRPCQGFRMPYAAEWAWFAHGPGDSIRYVDGVTDFDAPGSSPMASFEVFEGSHPDGAWPHVRPNPWGLRHTAGQPREWIHDSIPEELRGSVTDELTDPSFRLGFNYAGAGGDTLYEVSRRFVVDGFYDSHHTNPAVVRPLALRLVRSVHMPEDDE